MLGASGVGKTSLVARYVHSIFSDKYLTTLGVKISKKTIELNGIACDVMLWDLAGEDEFVTVQTSYLRNAHGYLLVVDGTRSETLEVAESLQQRAREVAGNVPFWLALNKADLADRWAIGDDRIGLLVERGWKIQRTSALSGQGVEEVFAAIATEMTAV